MKKIIIVLLFVLSIFLVSCSNELLFNKEVREDITIKTTFKVDSVFLFDNDKEVTIDYLISDNSVTFFSKDLLSLRKGEYIVVLKGEKEKKYTLKVEGINNDIPIIEKDNLFTGNDEYFVFIYTSNCVHCERAMTIVTTYYDYSLYYKLNSIYLLDDSLRSLGSDDENILNVSLVDDLRVSSYPLLIVIKENKISSFYKGNEEITSFLTSFFN